MWTKCDFQESAKHRRADLRVRADFMRSPAGLTSLQNQFHVRPGCWNGTLQSSVLQVVDVSADLQGRSQLDVHGGHEVLLLQQEQSLAVDFLRQELGGELLTAWHTKIKNKLNEEEQIKDQTEKHTRVKETGKTAEKIKNCFFTSVWSLKDVFFKWSNTQITFFF